ncbi:hypothetical protein BPUN_3664 [Candidatus Paraburkholderia kirkii]|nr:hypothetical protein BPUN_3664 [Candidatus Paraburkholderia kirkii]
MKSSIHYRGYAVLASAHRMRDKAFSANLLLWRSDRELADSEYRFYALDYFSNEADAVAHSRRWARDWIDTRG